MANVIFDLLNFLIKGGTLYCNIHDLFGASVPKSFEDPRYVNRFVNIGLVLISLCAQMSQVSRITLL